MFFFTLKWTIYFFHGSQKQQNCWNEAKSLAFRIKQKRAKNSKNAAKILLHFCFIFAASIYLFYFYSFVCFSLIYISCFTLAEVTNTMSERFASDNNQMCDGISGKRRRKVFYANIILYCFFYVFRFFSTKTFTLLSPGRAKNWGLIWQFLKPTELVVCKISTCHSIFHKRSSNWPWFDLVYWF